MPDFVWLSVFLIGLLLAFVLSALLVNVAIRAVVNFVVNCKGYPPIDWDADD